MRRSVAPALVALLVLVFGGVGLADTGGPDGGGYRFIDSGGQNGPPFAYEDTGATGIVVDFGGDED